MSECDVCDDFKLLQKATCDEKSFRWSVVKTLCYIVEALQTEESTPPAEPETVILPQVVKTAAQAQSSYGSYASVGLIDSVKKLNFFRVVNTLDCDLEFSFDGGAATAFTLPAGDTYERQFNLNLEATTSLQMRRVSGDSASTGSVFIEGDYAL